jgi:putative PIN family toxin of toxin-antitoxin system
MKVVIDTNIWISYLLGSLLQDLDEKILAKEIKIIVSEEMLKELSEVSCKKLTPELFCF